jgi:microcystin-dependent protein
MLQEYFLGQINLWASNEVPKGWARCDGSLLPVNKNQALYSLLGNHFGGDEEHFALPDFHDKAPRGYHYIIALQGIYPNAAK